MAGILTFNAHAQNSEPVVGWGNNSSGQTTAPGGLVETISLAAGDAHSLALMSDSTVVAWGDNTYHQTVVPAGLSNVTAIAAGGRHCLALRSTGRVVGWGDDGSGQATPPVDLQDVMSIAAGPSYSLALLSNGTVIAWGAAPAVPNGMTGVIAISAGAQHCLALKGDGTVAVWGDGSWGQLNVPAGLSEVFSIAAGGWHNLALKRDGRIACWGANNTSQCDVPSTLDAVRMIVAGGWHSVALRSNGMVVAWGANDTAQTAVPAGLIDVVHLAAGLQHTLALVRPGPPTILEQPASPRVYSGTTVQLQVLATGALPVRYQWRFGEQAMAGATNPMLTLPDIQFNQAGAYTVLVSNHLGSVTSGAGNISVTSSSPIVIDQPWPAQASVGGVIVLSVGTSGSRPQWFQWQQDGRDVIGATNAELILSDVTPASAGSYRVVVHNAFGLAASRSVPLLVAEQTNQSVFAWGDNSKGQADIPPSLTNAILVAAGHRHSLALRADGRVAAWGETTSGQCSVPGELVSVVGLDGGDKHSLAVTRDGRVVAWGDNSYGQSAVPSWLPESSQVAAGANHSLALTRAGRIVAWGDRSWDQLAVPKDLADVKAIAAGGWHNLALQTNGQVVAFGANNEGQCNVPQTLSNVVAIAAGGWHSVALKGDGTVMAWGQNSLGQTAVPPGLSKVIAVAAGATHTLALKADGCLVAWGSHSTVPMLGFVSAIAAGWSHDLAMIVSETTASIDGFHVTGSTHNSRGPVEVAFLNPFGQTTLLFTLDGSDPAIQGYLYLGPFRITESAVLRAVAYNSDFMQTKPCGPIMLNMLPLIQTEPDGGGLVQVTPPDGAYLSDSTIVLTALARPGWTFLEWRGDTTGTNPTVRVTMNRNRTVQAIFGTLLAKTAIGGGSIDTVPSAMVYPFGTNVRLTAVPHAGSYFAYWGGALQGLANPASLAITSANPSVVAVLPSFSGSQSASLTVMAEGMGETETFPVGGLHPKNTNVTLQAIPQPGQRFLGWSGAASGTQNPLVVTMNANKVITAHFTRQPQLMIRQSPGFAAATPIQLSVAGEWEATYTIEGSTNLVHWTPVAQVTNRYGTAQFIDEVRTNLSEWFYRAVGE